jgi:dTDP-glucose 4,6-dehydratase
VDYLVEGIYRLLQSDFVDLANLGNLDEISIKAFAEEIIDFTGSSSGIIYEELPKDDPQVRQPDISRAKDLLDWKPEYTRRDGIEATIGYFRRELNLDQREEA